MGDFVSSDKWFIAEYKQDEGLRYTGELEYFRSPGWIKTKDGDWEIAVLEDYYLVPGGSSGWKIAEVVHEDDLEERKLELEERARAHIEYLNSIGMNK